MESRAFEAVTAQGSQICEEGTIVGRVLQNDSGLTTALGAAKVNGPDSDKGQYMWLGTYSVRLDRGLTLDTVNHMCGFGAMGNQFQRCFVPGERVVVTWLNRQNNQLPLILDGATTDFYNKQVLGKSHLLDPGEQVLRSAMAETPGAEGSYPWSDNQFNNPQTKTDGGTHDENKKKLIRNPGAEVFYDKFGRIIETCRQPGYEFLVTNGRTDTGQDDVSSLLTVAAQDSYYSKISNDESEAQDPSEPLAPKPLNLVQYQLRQKVLKVVGDTNANRTVTRGILPRFDKWKFQPVVIRKYQADGDGQAEAETYAVRQERGQSTATANGYVRTITRDGDQKEFVARHYNGRVVGDHLLSVGGNHELKVKTTDRQADGSSNPINLVHQELLADGTVRLRVNEQVTNQAASFDLKISPAGTLEVAVKSDRGSFTDYKAYIKVDSATGDLLLDTKGKVTMTSEGEQVIDSTNDKIYLGGKIGAEWMVLGEKWKTLFEKLGDALNSWVPVPMDGGAALKSLLVTTFLTDYLASKTSANPQYYLSQNQKVA